MRSVIHKTSRFDAAHSLPNHAGKCWQLLGHCDQVELCFEGDVKPARGESDDGMVLDFLALSAWWQREVKPLFSGTSANGMTAAATAQWCPGTAPGGAGVRLATGPLA